MGNVLNFSVERLHNVQPKTSQTTEGPRKQAGCEELFFKFQEIRPLASVGLQLKRRVLLAAEKQVLKTCGPVESRAQTKGHDLKIRQHLEDVTAGTNGGVRKDGQRNTF